VVKSYKKKYLPSIKSVVRRVESANAITMRGCGRKLSANAMAARV